MRYVILLLALTAACEAQIEKNFFAGPLSTRVQRLREYSLDDQYRIFRYGNDKIEPPLMDLAEPIAERGPHAASFLVTKLHSESDDLAVRDILLIFESMVRLRTYDVKADKALIANLTKRVARMKDKKWQPVCARMLDRIKKAR